MSRAFFFCTWALSAGLPSGKSHQSLDCSYISHATMTPKSPLGNFLRPTPPTGLPWNVHLVAFPLFQISTLHHRGNARDESQDRADQDVSGLVKRAWRGPKNAPPISCAQHAISLLSPSLPWLFSNRPHCQPHPFSPRASSRPAHSAPGSCLSSWSVGRWAPSSSGSLSSLLSFPFASHSSPASLMGCEEVGRAGIQLTAGESSPRVHVGRKERVDVLVGKK